MPDNPLLTVAIPTHNRAGYLRNNLTQLLGQVSQFPGLVEVLVSDNASADDTAAVVAEYTGRGRSVRYLRNSTNIGSDRNIAQCFDLARGRYVLILGDDDVLLDGAMEKILRVLSEGNHGGVFVRPYGYNTDFMREKPLQLTKRTIVYEDVNAFLERTFVYATFVSAIIINKSLIRDIRATQFVNTNLVHTYLFYRAALAGKTNAYFPEYLIAARRTLDKDYDAVNIFISNYESVLDYCAPWGLDASVAARILRKILWYQLPLFMVRLRVTKNVRNVRQDAYLRIRERFGRDVLFWLCVVPILRLPKMLAVLWGYVVIIVGRIAGGEANRLWAVFPRSYLAVRKKLGKRA